MTGSKGEDPSPFFNSSDPPDVGIKKGPTFAAKPMIQPHHLLPLAIKAAEQACTEILAVYNTSDFQTELKGDRSPLTIADKRAHNAITSILQSTNLPILSEEGKTIPYSERKDWQYFWRISGRSFFM